MRPALLLVCGHLCDARMWAQQVAALADLADVRPLVLAAKPSVAELAAELLAAAPPRFALAGFSLGGYVTFEIVRQARERIERLAFIDTSARADTPEQHEQRLANVAAARAGKLDEVVDAFLERMRGPTMDAHPERMAQVAAMMRGNARRMYDAQQRAILSRPDSRALLPTIGVPTLVASGEHDAAIPLEVAKEIADGIPGAAWTPIAHAGHMVTYEQPEVVNAALRRWLSD